MPDATPIYGFPFGTLTDNPVDLLSVPELAQAVEDQLGADVRPIGDAATYSTYLSGADISFTSGQNKNILTSTVTLTRDQWVILSGRVEFFNQTGGSGGGMACYIDVDAVIVPQLSSGVQSIGNAGDITERIFFSLPAFSVFLTAGTHTIRLRGEKAAISGTVNAPGAQNLPTNTYYPCYLGIIV